MPVTASLAAARWSRVALLGSLLVPALLFVAVAHHRYGESFHEAQHRAALAARVVQEHAARVAETNDVLARLALAAVAGLSNEEIAARRAALHQQLQAATRGLGQLQSLWLWDDKGVPLVSSRVAVPPAWLNVADREYFGWARESAEAREGRWFVSRPLVSRTTGEPFFDFNLRRQDAQGRFQGVLSVSLYPSYFKTFYDEIARGQPGLSIALLRADGAVIARLPAVPLDTALRDESRLLAHMRAGAEMGTLAGTSTIDQVPRQLAFRRVGELPLYVAAAFDDASIVAAWQREMGWLAAFLLPLALGLAAVSWRAGQSRGREARAVQALQDEVRQRTRAETALVQAQKLEALGHITGGVAHDFNNLLMVVHTNNQLVRRLLAVGQPPDNALSAIDRAVTTGAQLTRQLLTFARRQPLQVISIRLRDALPPLLSLIQTSVGRLVQVSGNVGADVGCVLADRAELELALINLALNARDAMPEGGRLSVNVTRQAGDGGRAGRVAITVSDSGSGIPAELRDRVFEPFFTTKPPGQGTGLGLAQVYGFATQAGGSVQLDSEPGQGTSVTIYLPAGDDRIEPPADEPQLLPTLSGTVLLVEDNDEIANALVPLLQQSGARVLRAADAQAALRELAQPQARVDVVLSDIVMPGPLNGLDLALQLQREHPWLPIVLMTGYTSQLHKALSHGFQVLPKPCSPVALCRALADAARKRHVDVSVQE